MEIEKRSGSALVCRYPAPRAVVESECAVGEVIAECLKQHQRANSPHEDDVDGFECTHDRILVFDAADRESTRTVMLCGRT